MADPVKRDTWAHLAVYVLIVVATAASLWSLKDSVNANRGRVRADTALAGRICESQQATVAAVRAAFTEFKKTVVDSYKEVPPDDTRRARDAAFFDAVLKVLSQPNCKETP